jgi:plasmid stabilization system protein ParE
MAQSQKRSGPNRIVRLSPDAEEDRLLAYLNTEHAWGTLQADNYDEFLQTVMQLLADNPAIAPFVPEEKNTRSYVARWKNARHGHRIFFEETPQGIVVLRILHTAMNWHDHMDNM